MRGTRTICYNHTQSLMRSNIVQGKRKIVVIKVRKYQIGEGRDVEEDEMMVIVEVILVVDVECDRVTTVFML